MRPSGIIGFLTLLLLLTGGFCPTPTGASPVKQGPAPGSPEAIYLQAIKAGAR